MTYEAEIRADTLTFTFPAQGPDVRIKTIHVVVEGAKGSSYPVKLTQVSGAEAIEESRGTLSQAGFVIDESNHVATYPSGGVVYARMDVQGQGAIIQLGNPDQTFQTIGEWTLEADMLDQKEQTHTKKFILRIT